MEVASRGKQTRAKGNRIILDNHQLPADRNPRHLLINPFLPPYSHASPSPSPSPSTSPPSPPPRQPPPPPPQLHPPPLPPFTPSPPPSSPLPLPHPSPSTRIPTPQHPKPSPPNTPPHGPERALRPRDLVPGLQLREHARRVRHERDGGVHGAVFQRGS